MGVLIRLAPGKGLSRRCGRVGFFGAILFCFSIGGYAAHAAPPAPAKNMAEAADYKIDDVMVSRVVYQAFRAALRFAAKPQDSARPGSAAVLSAVDKDGVEYSVEEQMTPSGTHYVIRSKSHRPSQ